MIKYQAKIQKEKKSYLVSFPDLPGCFSFGESFEEALEMAREALTLYLEEAKDPKWEVPKPKNRKSKNYYWITPDEKVAVPLMIRKARLEKKLSQKDLAKRMGLSFQQIQKLETPGKSNPTIKTLVKISKALNTRLELDIAA